VINRVAQLTKQSYLIFSLSDLSVSSVNDELQILSVLSANVNEL
jgi:hypothetical protein